MDVVFVDKLEANESDDMNWLSFVAASPDDRLEKGDLWPDGVKCEKDGCFEGLRFNLDDDDVDICNLFGLALGVPMPFVLFLCKHLLHVSYHLKCVSLSNTYELSEGRTFIRGDIWV